MSDKGVTSAGREQGLGRLLRTLLPKGLRDTAPLSGREVVGAISLLVVGAVARSRGRPPLAASVK